MITLCNRGETGVLGGAPGCPPRAHSRHLPSSRVPAPLCRAGTGQHHRQDQARSEGEDRGSGTCSALLPEQGLAKPALPGSPQQPGPQAAAAEGGRQAGSPGTALPGTPGKHRPGGCSFGCDSQQRSVPNSHQRVWDRRAHEEQARLRPRAQGRAGEDLSPLQCPPEPPAPPGPCRPRSIRHGDSCAPRCAHRGSRRLPSAGSSSQAWAELWRVRLLRERPRAPCPWCNQSEGRRGALEGTACPSPQVPAAAHRWPSQPRAPKTRRAAGRTARSAGLTIPVSTASAPAATPHLPHGRRSLRNRRALPGPWPTPAKPPRSPPPAPSLSPSPHHAHARPGHRRCWGTTDPPARPDEPSHAALSNRQ